MSFFKIFLFSLFICAARTSFSASFAEVKEKGNSFFQERDYDLALEQYAASFELASSPQEFAAAHANTAQCYRLKGKIYLALLHFDKAVEYEPTHVRALHWSNRLRIEKSKALLSDQIVEYMPEFLDDNEAEILTAILSESRWIKTTPTHSSAVYLNGPNQTLAQSMLTNLIDNMRDKNLLPEGIEELGISFVRYDRNGSFEQHKDDETRVNGFVLSISVGGACSLDLINDQTGEKHSFTIAPKSAYVMKGRAHTDFTHGISDVQATRFCILFYKTVLGKKNIDELKYNLKEKNLQQSLSELTKAMLDISAFPGVSIEYF